MRTLFLSLIFVLALVPAPTHAQSFGQIFPVACKCDNVQIDNGAGTSPSAPAYGCVLQTLQNVIRIAFSLAFVLVTLALIYAGFVWMTSAGNPGKVEQGKHLLLNTLLGLFIMLGAWLIIDFVMKSIYNDSAQDSFGPWNDILADNTPGSECLIARNPTAFTSGTIAIGTGTASAEPTSGGSSNCAGVPASNLTTVEGSMQLRSDAAARFIAMRTAAAAAGITIRLDSAYRSPELQLEIWTRNQCSQKANQCSGQVAKPCQLNGGGSNHSSGIAIDVTNSGGAVQWVTAHGGPYGFNHSPTWHTDLHHFSQSGR